MSPLPKIDWEPNRIKLPQGFSSDDWGQLEEFYKDRISEGHIHWELDLTLIQFFNSTMLGLLIGFNAYVVSRGGSLRVIVIKKSNLAQLLKLTRVDRILEMNEV